MHYDYSDWSESSDAAAFHTIQQEPLVTAPDDQLTPQSEPLSNDDCGAFMEDIALDTTCLTSDKHVIPFNEPFAFSESFSSQELANVGVSSFDLEQQRTSSHASEHTALASQLTTIYDDVRETNQPDKQVYRLYPEIQFDASQMGYQRFKDLTNASPILVENNGSPLRATNSPFSDHINLFEHLLRQRWQKSTNLMISGTSKYVSRPTEQASVGPTTLANLNGSLQSSKQCFTHDISLRRLVVAANVLFHDLYRST